MVEHLLGLLKVKVVKGVNLAIRDVSSSDPYVVLHMGKQKLKTKVIKKNTNPEWNEELTLSVEDPNLPIKVNVYDKDLFSRDDSMGRAEFDIRPFVDVVKRDLSNVPNGTVVEKLIPSRQNFLAEESAIYKAEGKVMQDLALRLKDVECGEIELKLTWVTIPGARGLERY
ncbi:Calcium-dependent lipid-binding (CaLB domain) family protein [Rhynchospora pubera]|uniref:Calcium-dependent lipid-binding (CaLB domain) family protein n=2 Tax=Rhynchospora pubera TaxID=906938 RepID=A0AAV8GZN7_9POAL|nr:Calcium-dependent lipid-binding (CaLB domain) family protein [Rhynchospora pubera]KAJ4808203.1 Calcium-dependent lipid-binding (CaLB domain) family protein [Rhynchospora pubera]